MEVLKSDWKLFRACIGDWQEAHMERLVKEFMDILGGEENASDKFWNLQERISGIITTANLSDSSAELKESVDFLLRW